MRIISFAGMRRVCVWKYEILPADPEVTFPTVEVTYGDSLRKAVRTGQSGNGVFVLQIILQCLR